MSKAQALVDKIDGVPDGSTPRERKKFYGNKKRAQRKVERQIIRAKRQKEKEEKTPNPKKPKLKLKVFQGRYKGKGGGAGKRKNPSPGCNPGQGGRCFDD